MAAFDVAARASSSDENASSSTLTGSGTPFDAKATSFACVSAEFLEARWLLRLPRFEAVVAVALHRHYSDGGSSFRRLQ